MGITKRTSEAARFYYGWIIAAVALISMAFWLGIRASFSVYYVALLEDYAWSRSGSAGVQSMALITFPFLSLTGIYIVLVHNAKFLVDQGVEKMSAALIFAMVGVVSSIFRIFWGWLSDRIGREKTFTMGILCACLGVGSLLLFETNGSRLFTYSYFIFFGIGWGVTAPMFMSVSADLFNGRIFGLIYGFVEAGIGLAGALGAWLAGFIFDKTHSYSGAFFLSIVVMLLSCIFVWLAAPRKFSGRTLRLL